MGIFHQALIYLVIPFILWAALRLEQHGATSAIFIVSGIAIWGTVRGLGPFSLESMNDSLVLLQTFTAVVSLTGWILAAATIERRSAAESLHQRGEELATLNDSSRTFLDAFEIASIYQTICRLTVTRLGLDVAWIEAAQPRGRRDASACCSRDPRRSAGHPKDEMNLRSGLERLGDGGHEAATPAGPAQKP